MRASPAWLRSPAGACCAKACSAGASRSRCAVSRSAPPGIERDVAALSGGNQQKVVLAKWLLTDAKLLILDEPTRGVDIAAKRDIYDVIGRLADSGIAVLLISSDLPEVLGMSDRILVMREGRLVGRFGRAEASEERLLASASGLH